MFDLKAINKEVKEKVDAQYAVEKLVECMHIPNSYGMSDSDSLREEIREALLHPVDDRESITAYICNDVMREFNPKYVLAFSWEDNNQDAMNEAQEFFDWLDDISPGAFVLVITGDLINPECGGWHPEEKIDCETYDPSYSYYLIPRAKWEEQSAAILWQDQEWTANKMKCRLAGRE